MKILTWNVMRPKINEKRISEITKIVSEFDADLIFLTETNSTIEFPNYYKLSTADFPQKYNDVPFNPGENKATIYSKTKLTEILKTYDEFSSVCAETKSEIGDLKLYGSIIGFKGGRDEFFTEDLRMQKIELQSFSVNENLCFSGDLNIAFSGYPYPSKAVQNEMREFCEMLNLEIITQNVSDSALHIVMSKKLLEGKSVEITEKIIEKTLSDHNLILAEIQ